MTEYFMITLPSYDDVTAYLSQWSNEIVETAKENRFRVIELKGEDANRKNFEQRMKSNKPIFVMFNGHGNEKTIAGHDNQPLLSSEENIRNEKLSQGIIIFCRSCKSAASLGPECEKCGCKAFIGYRKKFIFVYDASRVSTPFKDEQAAYFFRVSNTIPVSLLNSHSVEKAMEKADVQLRKEVEYLKAHYDFFTQHIAPYLLWNKTFRTVCGDKNAKV